MTANEARFINKLSAFREAAWQLRAAWEKMEAAMPQKLVEPTSPFPMAFDDWCREVDQWAQVVCAERFGLPISDVRHLPAIGLRARVGRWIEELKRLYGLPHW
jgi:hypothetical protein